jgi:hypothetical protein
MTKPDIDRIIVTVKTYMNHHPDWAETSPDRVPPKLRDYVRAVIPSADDQRIMTAILINLALEDGLFKIVDHGPPVVYARNDVVLS